MPTLASNPIPVAHRTDGRASRQRAAVFWAFLILVVGTTAVLAAPLRAATTTRPPTIETLTPPVAAEPPNIPIANDVLSITPPQPWTCALGFSGLAVLVSCARFVVRPSSSR